MKQGLTHIIFVVDRSGSMSGIAKDMIGGYNEFIKKQKEIPGECEVFFYQFDDIYESVFENLSLQNVPELTDKTYIPRNCTALFDAVGKTINNIGKKLSDMSEDERPERILVITLTDGQNNASKEFDGAAVRDMIKHQTEVYKWDFVFLGSNIDAWEAGGSIGVKSSSTLQFANNSGSVAGAFRSLNANARVYRCSAAKSAYEFQDSDYAVQASFIDNDILKAKTLAAQANAKKSTKTK